MGFDPSSERPTSLAILKSSDRTKVCLWMTICIYIYIYIYISKEDDLGMIQFENIYIYIMIII